MSTGESRAHDRTAAPQAAARATTPGTAAAG